MVTLMHDRTYRLAVAWQNVGYNQPPHPGFFLGPPHMAQVAAAHQGPGAVRPDRAQSYRRFSYRRPHRSMRCSMCPSTAPIVQVVRMGRRTP
jgi:hypothetical protein